MGRVEKTVFISYRRTNAPWALAIFQDLAQHHYDVFYDFNGIASGDFERVVLENIRGRAHFLVLLTPSALERCYEPGDWLRREIETALDSQRNIVPLMLEGFDFNRSAIATQLTGKLAALKRYNALNVPVDYFWEAMARLRDKYLNIPLDSVLHPLSSFAAEVAYANQAAALLVGAVQNEELTAQRWFEDGRAHHLDGDLDAAAQDYTEAIRHKADYAAPYLFRAIVRRDRSDVDGALQDLDEAVRLEPGDVDAYYLRGLVREAKRDLDGALRDFDHGIHLKAGDTRALSSRALVRRDKGDLDGALQDLDEVIRIKPDDAPTYLLRANVLTLRGDQHHALQDCNEAIRLKPHYPNAYYVRALLHRDEGNLGRALRDCEEAISLKPDYAEAYELRTLIRREGA